MTLSPPETARSLIDLPEAGSSWSSRITLAPCARHCCACDFCFCGSLCAFSTNEGIFAFLNAAFRYGASKSVYRVDDTVSGKSTHALIDAACFAGELVRADAAAAISPTRTVAVKAAIAQRGSFFTCPPLVDSVRTSLTSTSKLAHSTRNGVCAAGQPC